jgi:hypothetical protein
MDKAVEQQAVLEEAFAELFAHLEKSMLGERQIQQMDDVTRSLLLKCEAPAMLERPCRAPSQILRMMRVRLGLHRMHARFTASPFEAPASLVIASKYASKRRAWENLLTHEESNSLVVEGGHGSVVWPGPTATRVARFITAEAERRSRPGV